MLELENLSFKVDNEDGSGSLHIIEGLNLSIEEGKFVVITGPNGGGKSTLARLIAGVETPTAGRIIFDGIDVTDLSITERAKRGIAFAFQQPVRFKGLQVLDLLRIAAGKRLGVGEACEYLSAVGLCAKDYIDREVNASLSGGELKRCRRSARFCTVPRRLTATASLSSPTEASSIPATSPRPSPRAAAS